MNICENCKFYKENFCSKKNIIVKPIDMQCSVFINKYQIYKVVKNKFLKSSDF